MGEMKKFRIVKRQTEVDKEITGSDALFRYVGEDPKTTTTDIESARIFSSEEIIDLLQDFSMASGYKLEEVK